jgi:hypothetical protein
MSLKSILKVANYYSVKYGFDKVASSPLKNKFKEFENYLRNNIKFVDLKYDVLPNYIQDIAVMFQGFGLSDEDMQVLMDKANSTATDKSARFHGSDQFSVYRIESRTKADKDYQNLKRKLLGKTSIKEDPVEDRLNQFKIKKLESKRNQLLAEMDQSGDFRDYNLIEEIDDQIRALKGLPPKNRNVKPTPLDEYEV